MADRFAEWVATLRGEAEAAEQVLEAEVRELRGRASSLEASDGARLDAEIEALEVEIQALTHRVAEVETRRRAERRERTATLLGECRKRIEEARYAEEAAALAAGGALYADVGGRSPAELQRLVEADLRVPAARRRLKEWLRQQDDLLGERNTVLVEVARLEARRADAKTEEVELRDRLGRRHDVQPAVIEALLALDPEQARRYREDTLEPRRRDALVEIPWGLPPNVLAEVQDGG